MFRAKCLKINKKENSTISSRNVLNIIKCNVFFMYKLLIAIFITWNRLFYNYQDIKP